MTLLKNTVANLGFWSAVGVSVAVAVFGILLIAGFWLQTDMISYFVCFLLAPAFVVMMSCIHIQAKTEKILWSHLGVTFAIIYAVLITISYYTQLTVVRVNNLQMTEEALQPFMYTPGSFIFSVNMLGYGFMCLAVLCIAPVFTGKGLNLWIRRLLIVNGLFFIPTWIFPALSLGSANGEADVFGIIALLFWCILFTPLAILVASYFKRLSADS